MLTVSGPRHRYCDGVSRRSFLQIGGLAAGGLTLANLLRAEQRSGAGKSQRSVIMIYLSGGLAHQDTFDLKPQAPAEVRGEFRPIATNVPGIQIGELLPRLARSMDKLILLRSLVGLRDEHSSFQNVTGFPMNESKRDGKPHFGSVIAKVQGPGDPIVPPFLDLFPTMQHKPYNSPNAGFLGRGASPVKLDGSDLASMQLRALSLNQLSDRRRLLEQIDQWKRDADGRDRTGMDTYYERAFDVLTSRKLVDALDVTREPAALRERYGRGSPKHLGDGAPMWNDQLLMARRLVEAGARCVTVAYGFWDTHGQNFRHLKRHLPLFDQGISALVEDIYARGLDRTTTLVVWGEFGRTPKINKDAGRDHWSRVNGALLSGGGMRTGQVIGSTDAAAGEARDQPIPYRDVLATVYHNLGIDPNGMVYDVSGRPTPILPSENRPIERVY
ncbi:MAG TPA: DUF1501 domain-containing protein [Gemmataceae bacterium]|nr:DUF1501 domain-containing protein [Gemmataceae bacterium]